jgi:hypothetical protein
MLLRLALFIVVADGIAWLLPSTVPTGFRTVNDARTAGQSLTRFRSREWIQRPRSGRNGQLVLVIQLMAAP